MLKWLKYSGIWIGLVINPFHWRIGLFQGSKEWPDERVFENSLHLGPIWIRVIIDDGRW